MRGIRAALLGVVVNALLAVVKLFAGFFGNSYALIADGVESMLDVVSSIAVWGGLRIASIPPDSDHQYGHGKAEPLTGIVVALVILAAAVGIAVQSIREIITPHHAPAPFTLVVLVLVVIAKETLYRTVFKVGESIGSTAVRADALHHRSDAITSGAAFVGISIALVAGEGYESADDWAALFATCIIAYNGVRLLRPAVAEIMDAAPPVRIEAEIRKLAKDVEGVAGLDLCRVRKIGLDYYVDLHVEVDGGLTVRKGHEISHDVKTRLCDSSIGIADVVVHIEPAEKIERE